MDKTDVTEDIMEEILENCNWIERIVIKIFYKEFEDIYNIIRIELINSFLK